MTWIAVRAAEAGALGAMIGAGAGLVFVGAQWWLGGSSLSIVFLLIGAGAICGAVASLLWIPRRMDVAARIDRQFNLHDLLSSAVVISQSREFDDSMRRIVVSQAETTAAGVPLSGVKLSRLGQRTYATAVTAVALVTTLAAIASPQSAFESRAPTAAKSMGQSIEATGKQKLKSQLVATENDGNAVDRSIDQTAVSMRANSPGGATSENSQRQDNGESSGAAAGVNEQRADFTTPSVRASSARANDHGATGGGVDGDAGAGAPTEGETTSRLNPTPPQQFDSDESRAPRSKHTPAAVPPAYREMVRKYFARE
jgi:hypothetical protein